MIEDISEAQAADLVEDLPSAQAAAIMEELSSDHLVDVLGEMDAGTSRAILAAMGRQDADEARRTTAARARQRRRPDDAGLSRLFRGLPLERSGGEPSDQPGPLRGYPVQYVYVIDTEGRLAGVLRMHDILFNDGGLPAP